MSSTDPHRSHAGAAAGFAGPHSCRPAPSDPSERADEMMTAIEAVYAERFAQFHRVACGIIGDAELGRDAVQEAFARAIRRRGDYRGDGPLEGWLWRTVVNVARDHCRMHKGATPFAECPEPGSHTWPSRPGPLEDVVRDVVASLPERQRLVLYLRYYIDMPYVEIGTALGIRTGTVSATLNAAHHTLRVALEAARRGEAPVDPRGCKLQLTGAPEARAEAALGRRRPRIGASTAHPPCSMAAAD